MVALDLQRPDELNVTQSVEVRVNKRRSLIPDVLVTTAEAASRGPSKYQPHEVVLVVEIVSPGSQTIDRFAKPALYAEAEIPFFWRIEMSDGIEVHTYRLDLGSSSYIENGLFTTTIVIDQPWAIRLPIDRITPRYFPRSSPPPS